MPLAVMSVKTPVKPSVRAIILDVFDTVLLRQDFSAENPYTQILKDLKVAHPQRVAARDYDVLLTQPVGFADYIARYEDASVTDAQRAIFLYNAQEIFAKEKRAYAPRPEWQDFLYEAKQRGLKVCLGSNLALPYTDIVEEKLGEVPHKIYSCAIGVRKPAPEFFEACCKIMQVAPCETAMIGNSFSSDIKGAQQAGMAEAFWIPRIKDRQASNGMTAPEITSLMDIFACLPRL